MTSIARVLIVAGSDSGGGAGIQADIKTVTALGGFAMTAVTALTAQNTQGVFGILDVPAEFVARQMRLVLDDLGADCIKLGMLHRVDVIDAVADVLLTAARGIPLVVDPVMIAKGGQPLLQPEAIGALRRRIVPLATVLTPNLPEAAALADGAAGNPADGAPGASAEALAQRILALGCAAVLVKGGHAEGPMLRDVLVRAGSAADAVWEDTRIDTAHTHGTGCTLASAIATGLAQGLEMQAAVGRARAYVRAAILQAPGLGHGHGPLQHGHTVRAFAAPG